MATDIIVYQYGLFPPTNWDETCEAEMRRMVDFWNELVQIGNDATSEYRKTINDASTEELVTEFNDLLHKLETKKIQRKSIRAAARKKVATDEIDGEIEHTREALAQLRPRLKEDQAKAREIARLRIRRIEGTRRAAVKTARQNSGLYWGNYNAVIAAYETSRQKAIKEGSELRFHRFNGSGRIVNQIQGGVTVEGLFAAANNQVNIRKATVDDWPKPKLHVNGHLLTATVFSDKRRQRQVVWPFILHRPFPDDAVIKEVHVTRRVRGPRSDEWHASFVCRIPVAEKTHHLGGAAGIDLGWRRVSEGIRVATLIDANGRGHFVVLPERIVEGARYHDRLRAIRDARLNEVVARLRALEWGAAPPALRDVALASLGTKRVKAGLLVSLAALWKETTWEPSMLKLMNEDLAQDKREWREMSGLSLRLQRARRDHYRCEAKRIASTYSLIGAEVLSVKQMSRKEYDKTPSPSHFYRRVAAPSEFMSCLRWAAKKHGAQINLYLGKSTWICARCGVEHKPVNRANLYATCPHCSATWDVDINAAENLLRTALTKLNGTPANESITATEVPL
jgi:rubrerythrin